MRENIEFVALSGGRGSRASRCDVAESAVGSRSDRGVSRRAQRRHASGSAPPSEPIGELVGRTHQSGAAVRVAPLRRSRKPAPAVATMELRCA
eukprot:355368-Chlamydomonas_euryale.AAC.24